MNVTLTDDGYTLDGMMRLVPVELEEGSTRDVFGEIYTDLIKSAPNPPQSLSSILPDCRTCANRGHINGLSQEAYCDSCMWYGAYWKKNNYNQRPEPAP